MVMVLPPRVLFAGRHDLVNGGHQRIQIDTRMMPELIVFDRDHGIDLNHVEFSQIAQESCDVRQTLLKATSLRS